MPAPKIIPRYTSDDYQKWDGEWELWDGIPIAMTPSPFGPHQRMLAGLSYCFVDAIRKAGCRDCEVVVELDWIVDPHTVVRPDLSVVCRADLERFIQQPPALIIEILSPTTSHRDQVEKRALYQQQGVGHYLIADPSTSRIVRYSIEANGQYKTDNINEWTSSFDLANDCNIKVDFSSLSN